MPDDFETQAEEELVGEIERLNAQVEELLKFVFQKCPNCGIVVSPNPSYNTVGDWTEGATYPRPEPPSTLQRYDGSPFPACQSERSIGGECVSSNRCLATCKAAHNDGP